MIWTQLKENYIVLPLYPSILWLINQAINESRTNQVICLFIRLSIWFIQSIRFNLVPLHRSQTAFQMTSYQFHQIHNLVYQFLEVKETNCMFNLTFFTFEGIKALEINFQEKHRNTTKGINFLEP